ncbi:ABC transporter ATP-binding protein [Reinekea forsetii]|nr:ABC transporter ATP-binding protein [Reinekea forsetii]
MALAKHKDRLTMVGVTKRYPGCIANDSINLAIDPGEIHALLGENGAGKSTLMKILYGVTKPDAGRIYWNGQVTKIASPKDARALGIGMVFQHFSLFETLTVKENIELALGNQAGDSNTLAQRIRDISEKYGMPLDPDRTVATLSTGEKQRVEIVRCLLLDIQLLILDEPTSVLTPQEVDKLFETLRTLSQEGCSILFISHKLHEVTSLCDQATILRHGRVTGECNPSQETPASIARMMVGDDTPISNETNRAQGHSVFLDIRDLSIPAKKSFDIALKSINFQVKAGEIVGIAGVAGNGQEELLKALSGEERYKSKSIWFGEYAVDKRSPLHRRRLGMSFVPEDRLGRGAVPDMDLSQNALLTSYDSGLLNKGFIKKSAVTKLAQKIIQKYKVKAESEHATAASLSGGNLQKFIIGREVEQQPALLVMAHPTWGVDIGAQTAIHDTIFKLRNKGCAVLVVSEDLDELYKICDRLGAICDGEVSPFLPTDELPLTQLGQWMAGDFTLPANASELTS